MVDTTDAAEAMATDANYETYLHAMQLHAIGFSLIPISRTSKRPIVKWKPYQTEQCTTADVLKWFGTMSCRIGIVTGELSGVVVVDCDSLRAVETFLDDSGLVESVLRQRTKRGMHFFYRHPGADTRNRRGCLDADIDIRGDGGYVVAYGESGTFTRQDLTEMPVYQAIGE